MSRFENVAIQLAACILGNDLLFRDAFGITQYLLGLEKSEALDAYSVCIQVGAILAVLNLYFFRVGQMWQGICGKNPAGLRLIRNLLLGFLPAMIIGLLLAKPIKAFLFNAETVVVTWALGGIAILLFVRHQRRSGKGDGCKGAPRPQPRDPDRCHQRIARRH